ncbi:hypothetical protein E1B28_008812 [Marasmius oreades]|uniref:Peptide N-acetyl-beta-D-glucosaminyl asparaginase amidase A N-terminal domain-containing protein n=1 Tax=Marasmius oreades TaxID=181124 RepID=A0A9P7S0R7_9AGAR|nr:uncharacterized protein E1B28_008812 [Marasmius oreades]KAG7092458.1 hypothetical protein E1B28_008812 [Marasmius oreades]
MRFLTLFPALSNLAWLSYGARLVDFQVAQPPVVPQDAKECTVKVLQRDFAFSFGMSEVVQLNPPTDCGAPGSWAAITLNFTVTSNGTQFDRLGIFTFQNTEIWRTSTPEPTRGDGIVWTYVKDVTQYIPLFAEPGTFILQLDNLIQPGLDGIYSTILHATYYASSSSATPAKKADLILPLSTFANDTGNDASVPPSFSLNITFPRNTVQVYAEVFASGNGQEEFWYNNVPNEFFSQISPDITNGDGPFREIRLLIDGKVAGVVFPYAVIFTGGYTPPLWRPITSYGALELPTYFLDVTPFVPILADGNPHNFTIDVISAETNHTINQNWFVSGNLQVVTDSSPKPTTGKITRYEVESFPKTTTAGMVRGLGDFDFTVTATRELRIEADVISGSGRINHVVFRQALSYSNFQNYKENATFQTIQQNTTGTVVSIHSGSVAVSDIFSYPIDIEFEFLGPDQMNWTTFIDHSYDRDLLPNPLRLASSIHNRQTADGFFQLATGGNFGNGTNNNTFSYIDSAGNTYSRRVDAAFNNITLNEESGSLAHNGLLPSAVDSFSDSETLQDQFAGASLPNGIRKGT